MNLPEPRCARVTDESVEASCGVHIEWKQDVRLIVGKDVVIRVLVSQKASQLVERVIYGYSAGERNRW